MIIQGTRFGDIDYQAEDVIHLDEGLIGFPGLSEFILVDHKPDSPFRWLQSVDEAPLAFLVTEPRQFVPDYNPLASKGAEIVFTTVAIPAGKAHDMTLNLAGPIMIDAASKRGRQVVLDDGSYTVKHRVFAEANQATEKAAA